MLVRERSTDNAVGTGDFYYDIVERSADNAAGTVAFYYDGHYGWFGHIVRIIGR